MLPVRRAQSTVELLLVVSVLFGVLFACIELAFWFGGTHYVNYAAFAAARAQQVGQDPEEAASLLLDGNVTRDATVSGAGSSVTIDQPWEADLPFTKGIGDLSYDVTVTAGPDEEGYEGRSAPMGLVGQYADNNCRGGC